MAYSYTNNSIHFTNLQDVGTKYPLRHRLNKFEDVEKYNDPVRPFVNAVEIDWNGAQLGE